MNDDGKKCDDGAGAQGVGLMKLAAPAIRGMLRFFAAKLPVGVSALCVQHVAVPEVAAFVIRKPGREYVATFNVGPLVEASRPCASPKDLQCLGFVCDEMLSNALQSLAEVVP